MLHKIPLMAIWCQPLAHYWSNMALLCRLSHCQVSECIWKSNFTAWYSWCLYLSFFTPFTFCTATCSGSNDTHIGTEAVIEFCFLAFIIQRLRVCVLVFLAYLWEESDRMFRRLVILFRSILRSEIKTHKLKIFSKENSTIIIGIITSICVHYSSINKT